MKFLIYLFNYNYTGLSGLGKWGLHGGERWLNLYLGMVSIYIGTLTPSVFRCIPVYIAVDYEGCVTIWGHENAGLSFIELDSDHI